MNATLDRRCPREGEVEAALDGRLDAAAEAAALAHARDCLACAARERSLRSLREAARALPPAAPDADAARRMRAEVLAGALRRGRGPASPWAYAAAAAAALVVVGAAVALRRPSPAPAVDGIDLAGAGMLRPERGAVYRVERAGPDTRIGLTEGVIHLAVAHRRRGERFVIALGDAEVEVRGTRFLVDAHDGHLRRVRVTEGLVAVRRAGAAERLVAAGGTLEVTEAPPPGPAAATIAPLPAEAPSPEASPAPASAPRVEAARAAASAAASRDFRAGALAYNRGEHAEAAAALQRFLAAAPARDPRREDARYVLVLALDASRDEAADRAAREYLAEFPRGLRFAEVTVRLTRRLAARGACDAAARVALGMPENADAALRTQVVQALSRCPAAE